MGFLTRDPIDPSSVIQEVRGPSDGALTVFIGQVRDHHEGREVLGIEFEAYEPMAESEIGRIVDELTAASGEVKIGIHHRLGALVVGDVVVVIAVASPHRNAAFVACRAAIEALKSRVPIWKKERGPDGVVWVDPGAPAEGGSETR